jgi:hypothetical protein
MKHGNNCECCKCEIASDTFTFEDGTDLGDLPGWSYLDTDCATSTSLGYTAEVQDNVLETTDSGFQAIKASGLPGALIYEYIVEADVKGDDEGDELELIAMDAGASRCYQVRVRLIVSDDCPYLQIWYYENTFSGGLIETLLREIPLPDAAVGEWHHLKACVLQNPEPYPYGGAYSFRVLASVRTNLDTIRYVSADLDFIDERPIPGIGTGDITTKAYFDNYEWTKHQRNGGTDGALTCPRCKVGDCEYSSDDFSDGIDCVWDNIGGATWTAPVTAHSHTTVEATYPIGSGAPKIVHKIGHPYNRPYNSVTVWCLIENEGDTIGVTPVAQLSNGTGPTVYVTAGPDDGGEGCGYVQFGSTGAVHLPVQNVFAGVWFKVTACYGWHPNGLVKILSVVINDESVLPPPGRYMIEATDYDTDDFNHALSGSGPYWYSSLIYADGALGNKVYFRDFEVSMSWHPDPLLTGYYGSTLACPKCFDDADFCLWATELCVGTYSDCMANDTGSWNCAESSCGGAVLRGAHDSQRIWQIANPWGQTSQRVEGRVISNGESDQTVILCYDQDTGDYVGLKFTWDNTCGKVELIQNGVAIETHESEFFKPNVMYYFCFSHINGFAVAAVHEYNFTDCTLSDYAVLIQAELPDPVIGIWCGVSTGTWASGAIVANFHELIFYTARNEDFPECPICDDCAVLHFPSSDDLLGCEWTGNTLSTHNMIADGETVATTFPTFDDPDKAAIVSFEFTGFNQSFYLSLDGYWIRLNTGTTGNDGSAETSEGDDVPCGSFTNATTIFPGVVFTLRICVRNGVVRLEVAGFVSFKRTAAAVWTNTLELAASGGDMTYNDLRVEYAYRCLRCYSVCEACDSYRLPSQAIIDAAFATGQVCCDSLDGIYYIEMDGCTGDSGNFDGEIGGSVSDCHGRWRIYIEQFVGYVRIMVELHQQDVNFGVTNPGVSFYWSINIPTIGNPAADGVIDCVSQGRMRLEYLGVDLNGFTSVCAPAGVSSFIGTHIFLELA